MTFNKLTFIMFKANIKKYLLYFVCNSFTVMILFTYLTLMTNESFMDYSKVDSSISGNLLAPSFVIAIFSFFFIIYTQSAFIRFRKTEFGLFMALGTTNKEIAKIMALENSLIAVASLGAGLAAGTVFSSIFYFIIVKAIHVSGFTFSLSYKSYLYTTAFFSAVYALVILLNVVMSFSYNILDMLKSLKKEDRDLTSGKIPALIGIAALIISVVDFIVNSPSGKDEVFFRSILLFLVGVYLVISNFPRFLTIILKASTGKYYKNLFFVSNIKHSFRQSKKVICVISLLIGITILFTTLGLALLSDSVDFGTAHNPYDIAYLELYGKNAISEEKLNSIIQNGETPLKFHKTIELIGMRGKTILSDKNLNAVLGTSIHVQSGKFINLFQIVQGDGYSYSTVEMKKAYIETEKGTQVLTSQGVMKKMLFNNINILNDSRYLIVNDSDYENIKASVNPSEIGKINLMNFKDYKKTGSIAKKLEAELESYNKNNTERYCATEKMDIVAFEAESKIGGYTGQKQSGEFLLLLVTFVGVLFYVSSCVIIHFKMLTELESEKEKYKKLYKIGITKNEVKSIVSKELSVQFFLPYVIAIFFAVFYSYYTIKSAVKTTYFVSIVCPFIVGILYLGLQAVYYVIYKRIHINKICNVVISGTGK